MKAVHIMPALLLQKDLVSEAETLQSRLPKSTEKKTIQTISKQFKDKMEKGDVHGAIKLLTNNMSGGVLPLDDRTIQLLKDGRETNENNLLHGPIQNVNPIVFDAIDEQMVMKAALATQGGSGPSRLDAEGWRKPLTSKMFGVCGKDLRKSIANVTKKPCTTDQR